MTTTAIIAAGEARAAQVATMPRTQLIRGVDMNQPINWGPEREYTGNGECPADARDVPCMAASDNKIWRGNLGHFTGRAYNWQHVAAYRLPAPPADPVLDALEGLVCVVGKIIECRPMPFVLLPSLWESMVQTHNAALAALKLAKGEKP